MENELVPLVEEGHVESLENLPDASEEETVTESSSKTAWSRHPRFLALGAVTAVVFLVVGVAVGYPGSASMPSMDASSATILAAEGKCGKRCMNSKKPWETKCSISCCSGCDECLKLPEKPVEAHTPYQLMTCEGSVLTTESLTLGDYDAIVKSITDGLNSLDSTCNVDTCPQADVAGCILRMAGHDFMDYNKQTNQGGSDGCTDMKEEDNAGLQACLILGTEFGFELNSFYQKFCTKVSLADFIVIAAEAIMSFTRGIYLKEFPDRAAMDFRSSFKYGRTTAMECDYSAHRLPSPEKCDDVTKVFVDNLSLKWDEAAALMGVHTLGRASIENSGYDGWWSDPENSRRFNNNYFVSLLAKGWMPERAINGNPEKNQWKVSDVGFDPKVSGKQMMLDTDMCLAYSKGLMTYNGLAAAKDDCCTWTFATNLAEGGIDTYNDGKFCGVSDKETVELWKSLPTGTSPKTRIALWETWSQEHGVGGFQTFSDIRAHCCLGQKEFTGEFEGYSDCGGVSHPTGLAARPVEEFANDEGVWVSEFMTAWGKATSRGFTGLKALKPTVV